MARPSRVLDPKNKTPKPQSQPTEKMITCFACRKDKHSRNFYKTDADENAVGYIPICKECIKKKVERPDGTYDLDAFREILANKYVDKPFLATTWQAAVDSKDKNKIGKYFTLINNGKLKHLKNVNSDPEFRTTPGQALAFEEKNNPAVNNPDAIVVHGLEDMTLDDVPYEVKKFWGVGYSPVQYVELNELWKSMSPSRQLKNGTEIEFLKDAINCIMLKRKALTTGDIQMAQKYDDIARKDLLLVPEEEGGSESDYFGGIKIQEIEQTNDFIPLFPDIIADDYDMIIKQLDDYQRQLLKLPPTKLGEVLDFSTYAYESGQEVLFPTDLDKKLSDPVLFDIIKKYRDKDPEQFDKVLEAVKFDVRPKE